MKLDWKSALGIALSVVLLWWTLKDVSFVEVWHVLRRSNLPLLIFAAAASNLMFPLRAIRWRIILEPIASVPFGPLWRATAVGMMVNNVWPARAGELARAYALNVE